MPDRFAGIAFDSVPDQATRNAFRRLLGSLGNMWLAGLAAERPSSARFGAIYQETDGDNLVWWYAGPAIGWLQIHSEGGGGVPTVLHETLSDLQGGQATPSQHYHLTAAQALALVDNMATQGAGYGFGPTRVLFADADGHLIDDAGMTYDPATKALTIVGPFSFSGALTATGNALYTSGGYQGLRTAAGGAIYFDVGGLIFVRDVDGAYATRFTIDSATGQVLHVAGTATAPAIANITRPDDGFYFISDGVVGVALNGAEAMRFIPTAFVPASASGQDLGSTSAEWANVYVGTGRVYFGAAQAASIYISGTDLLIG
jgi:hypothetical protein